MGHTIYPVTVLCPAALMQRPGCEPESLIATQRRPVVYIKKKVGVWLDWCLERDQSDPFFLASSYFQSGTARKVIREVISGAVK